MFIILYCITEYHFVLHITSYHITLYHIKSYHVILHRIISYFIALDYMFRFWWPWALKYPWACVATAFKRSVRQPVFVLRLLVRKTVPNIYA